jgi:tRNA nucleotidyltransferase (CCA-adding enzyme)
MESQVSNKFKILARQIAEKGGRLYIVGGAVRDMLLEKEPHDIDYCVAGLSEDELREITHVSRVQGSSFPVFIINRCEVAFARKERKTGTGHKSFEMFTDKSVTIEEDLARRDITINSMAIDVLTRELIDPFGGQKDLKDGIIHHTTEAFKEDPLRVYRVARFASKFGFKVAPETIELMHSMKDELKTLSAERVFAEFRKAMLEDHPETFFEVLKDAGVLDVHFKELNDLIGVEQPIEYHPEGDAFVHTMEVLQRVVEKTPNAELGSDEELTRFGALVHDLGKGATPREEWPHHYGHEERGIELIRDFCKRIKAPNVFFKAGKVVSSLHMNCGRYNSLKAGSKVKIFIECAGSKSISFKGLEIITRADSKDESISFAELAEATMNINARTTGLIERCTTDGVLDYEKLKQMLTQKRVEFVKSQEKSGLRALADMVKAHEGEIPNDSKE